MNPRKATGVLLVVAALVLVAPQGLTATLPSPFATLTSTASAAYAVQNAQAPPVTDNRSLGERALDVNRVLAVDIGSRPAGSAAEREAASYLAQQFTEMGYAVEVVPFELRSGATSQNVVAQSKSEDPNLPIVIVGGHYDTVPAGPGANDNGSGTAATVEVARQLSWFPVPNVNVRYVAFGAEEIGLLGSAAYVRTLSASDRSRVRLAMSLDMLAVGEEPEFAGTEPWVRAAMAFAASQGYSPRDATAEHRGLSDHQSFLDAGIPAVLFHASPDPAYHTARDVIERIQPIFLDLMGNIAINLIRIASE